MESYGGITRPERCTGKLGSVILCIIASVYGKVKGLLYHTAATPGTSHSSLSYSVLLDTQTLTHHLAHNTHRRAHTHSSQRPRGSETCLRLPLLLTPNPI
jgi:hypothetical protein